MQIEKEKKERRFGEILDNINNLLGFIEWEDKIKWSNANKKEMLRLEKAIIELKGGTEKWDSSKRTTEE